MFGKRSFRSATISAVSSIDSVVWVTKARLLGSFGAMVLASSAVSIRVTAPAGSWRGRSLFLADRIVEAWEQDFEWIQDRLASDFLPSPPYSWRKLYYGQPPYSGNPSNLPQLASDIKGDLETNGAMFQLYVGHGGRQENALYTLVPGGRLVIIDKNAAHWGKLETPQWEKWFHAEELCRELVFSQDRVGVDPRQHERDRRRLEELSVRLRRKRRPSAL